MDKKIKVGQEVWVLEYPNSHHKSRVVKSKVVKVGRKYFEIDSNGNKQYYLEVNPNGYYYNSQNHMGYSSHVFLTEDEVLKNQNLGSISIRIERALPKLSYSSLQKLELYIKELETTDKI